MIVKVKEPLAVERKKLRRGQVLFAYLHLAPDRAQTEEYLLRSGVTAIAYETVTSPQGGSCHVDADVGGRRPDGGPCRRAGALEKENGGRGVLLSRRARPCRRRASSFSAAASPAPTPRWLRPAWAPRLLCSIAIRRRCAASMPSWAAACARCFPTRDVVEHLCRRADVVIATVLVPGATAPKLISAQTVKAMKPGAVIINVAIDQGGCAETSRPTTHSHPTYIVDDVVHYCVANMPGAVARTSTFALSNVTTGFVLALADKGWRLALPTTPILRDGLNVHDGRLTYRAVADALELPYTPADEALRI